MPRQSTLRLAAAVAAATGCFLVHCDDGPGEAAAGGAGGEAVLPEVIYDGRASDEALTRIWDRIDGAEPDAAKAATITLPADGAAVAAAPASDLAWELEIAVAPRLLPHHPPAPARRGLPRLAFGPAAASAHLPPVSGWIYLVELTPTGSGPIRLFTTNMRWTPDPTTWAAVVAAGGASLRIFNTYLNENVVEEGPYVMPSPTTFTVIP